MPVITQELKNELAGYIENYRATMFLNSQTPEVINTYASLISTAALIDIHEKITEIDSTIDNIHTHLVFNG